VDFQDEWSTAIRVSLPKEPTRAELSLTKILYALSDEWRLDIVQQLDREGPSPCGAFEEGRPKSSLSHHFRVLRESGLVATTRQGTVLMNRLRREDLSARFPNLLDAILSEGSRRSRRR